MLIRIFDVPIELRTFELKMLVRRSVANRLWRDVRSIDVSLSPVPTADRGPHGVLISGLAADEFAEYRLIVEVVSGACAPYFMEHGYLWYGCSSPRIAMKRE